VPVGVGVAVGVGVGVGVDVGVSAGVGVGVGVGVDVGVSAGVCIDVGVGVDMDVGLGVGSVTDVVGEVLSPVSGGKVPVGVGVGVGGVSCVCCDTVSITPQQPTMAEIRISIMPTHNTIFLLGLGTKVLATNTIMLTIIPKMATIICQALASICATPVFLTSF
jgi:hypothetical protein